MISLAHLKRRLGQYAALWVGGFLLTGAAVLAGLATVPVVELAGCSTQKTYTCLLGRLVLL